MDGHVDNRRTSGAPDEGAQEDRSKVYGDLRRRNERRADLARTLDAKRRQRIARDMEALRQRRFHTSG
jgi:hypothetical protein